MLNELNATIQVWYASNQVYSMHQAICITCNMLIDGFYNKCAWIAFCKLMCDSISLSHNES
jgi:hypothetical protein